MLKEKCSFLKHLYECNIIVIFFFVYHFSALCIDSLVLSEEYFSLPHQYFYHGRSKVHKFNKIYNLLRHPPIDSLASALLFTQFATMWVKTPKYVQIFYKFHCMISKLDIFNFATECTIIIIIKMLSM